MELAPPGFGSYAPLMRNKDGILFVMWWLSDYETANRHAQQLVDKGLFEYGQAIEVFKPGMYQ